MVKVYDYRLDLLVLVDGGWVCNGSVREGVLGLVFE